MVIILLLIFNVTPAYTERTQNISTNLSSEVILETLLNSDDIVYRGRLGYKKSTNIPFTGEITGKEKGHLKNGRWDGPYLSYYNTGQLERQGGYTEGKREGPWKFFRVDGNIMSEGSYNNGLSEGTWKFYHLFGANLQIITNFKDGKKDGAYRSFFGNGKLMQKGTYKDNKPTGLWIFYDKNGVTERSRKLY